MFTVFSDLKTFEMKKESLINIFEVTLKVIPFKRNMNWELGCIDDRSLLFDFDKNEKP